MASKTGRELATAPLALGHSTVRKEKAVAAKMTVMVLEDVMDYNLASKIQITKDSSGMPSFTPNRWARYLYLAARIEEAAHLTAILAAVH